MSSERININCGNCEAILDVSSWAPGEKVKCPHCGSDNVVPEDLGPPAVQMSQLADYKKAMVADAKSEPAGPVRRALRLIAFGALFYVFNFGFRIGPSSFAMLLIGRILIFTGLRRWQAIERGPLVKAALTLVALAWLMDALAIFDVHVWFTPLPLMEVLLILLILRCGCLGRESLVHLDRPILIAITLQSIVFATSCVLTFSAPVFGWIQNVLSGIDVLGEQAVFLGALLPFMLMTIFSTTTVLVVIVAMLWALKKKTSVAQVTQ
ncbi:MAG: hypothetical protein ABIJ61_14300 [bacterium]